MTPRDHLRALIQASGLSIPAYAQSALTRHGHTVRRWLDGTSPIPQPVLKWLAQQPIPDSPVSDTPEGRGD